MVLIPTRWLKIVLFPLWPFALAYWWRANQRGTDPDWGTFDLWAGRAWWSVLGIAFLAGAISAAVH